MFGKNRKSTCGAVVVAAGSGTRMRLEKNKDAASDNKVFLEVGGTPVLAHTLLAFEACREIDQIVVVTRECDIPLCKKLADEFGIIKLKSIVCGGETRQASVKNGLLELADTCELAAIHDGARCMIRPEEIAAVVEAAEQSGAASLGVMCVDSLKRVDEAGDIIDGINREGVCLIQTPQVFVTEEILAAHIRAEQDGVAVTDDCAIAQYAGIPVQLVEGSKQNIKLTTPEDLMLAEALFALDME